MLDIVIKTVRHSEHRYETVGDYWTAPNGQTQIRVSKLPDERMEFLVAVHELIEQGLTKWHGITEEAVTQFDVAFEALREEGDETEPGDSPNAPYRKEHFFATSVERLLAAELGVDWMLYEMHLAELALGGDNGK